MEAMVKHPEDSVQHELVREYCGEAEGRIMAAASHADAITIKEEWCKRFQNECESTLIFNAASAHLDGIMIRKWKENRE